MRISALSCVAAAVAIFINQMLDVPIKALALCQKINQVFQQEETTTIPTLLSGSVSDPTGKPLPGVEILLTEYGQRIRTNANGRYSLELAEPHSNLAGLRAVKPGYQPRNLDVPLGDPSFHFVMNPVESE